MRLMIHRINLNDQIKVKLTDLGKEIYYHRFDATNQIAGREVCKPCLPKEDKDGYTKFQLWDFIRLYGPHIDMILPNVVLPLEMVWEEAEQPEIIRCKECKHRDAKIGFCEGRGWPMQLVPDDGFCDKGERSEE